MVRYAETVVTNHNAWRLRCESGGESLRTAAMTQSYTIIIRGKHPPKQGASDTAK